MNSSPQFVRMHKGRLAPWRQGGRHLRGSEWEPKVCQWIEGEPSFNEACKCGAPVVPEKPYCETHCKRAYVKVDNSKAATD